MTNSITISFSPLSVITWVIIGLVAGLMANWLVRGGSVSTGGSILLGLIGAFIGGGIFALLNIQVSAPLDTIIPIRLIDVIVAFLGALLVLFIVSFVFRRR
jgi:uncharacterized membrane protein YeaQ/YmgE (transglycosylase-associated protein family)